LRDKHRLRVFENRQLRRIFELKRDVVAEDCKDYLKRSLMGTSHQMLFG
jgi:hypothetical protein